MFSAKYSMFCIALLFFAGLYKMPDWLFFKWQIDGGTRDEHSILINFPIFTCEDGSFGETTAIICPQFLPTPPRDPPNLHYFSQHLLARLLPRSTVSQFNESKKCSYLFRVEKPRIRKLVTFPAKSTPVVLSWLAKYYYPISFLKFLTSQRIFPLAYQIEI